MEKKDNKQTINPDTQKWIDNVLKQTFGMDGIIENARIAKSLNGRPRYAYHFNGKTLSEYDRLRKTREWKAMSGRSDYQDALYQARTKRGPLPEGDYTFNRANWRRFQDLSPLNKLVSSLSMGPIKMGAWPGGTYAWGDYRVDLTPTKETNTMGRTNTLIHGGGAFGSGGCVDLEKGINDFYNTNRLHMQDVFPLKVKYDDESFK